MHGSFPLPSPPSPGSGASPSSAAISGLSAPAAHPRAAILTAHETLAALDPFSDRERLFFGILTALLTAAQAGRGVLVDPAQPARSACAGLEPPLSVLEALAARAAGSGRVTDPLSETVSRALFGTDADGVAPGRGGGEAPVAIPLTVQEEALALLVLERPPGDPVGFASVTAHAARLLDSLRMADKVQKADFELKYRVWELQSLYDVGLSIAGTLDLDSLAEDILYKSISLLNARTGTLIVCDRAADTPVYVRHLGEPLLDGESARLLPSTVLRCNTREERVGLLANAPAEKLLAVPILADGRWLGVLVVADKENRGGSIDDFTEADERVLSLFANQAAIALENARLHREAVEKEKMEREMELAASIQKTILPDTLPDVPGLVISGANRPTKQVGGDYFDVYPLADGRTAFCVADVSGKGVPAALLVSTVHACLHLLVPNNASDLPGLVARVNRHLVGFSSTRKFATLFIAVYDPASGVLTYVNAGHNPGLWLSPGGVVLLPSGGVPVGMMPGVVHKQASIRVAPGDTILLYSDGITEALNGSDEEFGMERLTALAIEGRMEAPSEISRRIFGAVNDFTTGVAQYDDQTVLIARVSAAS
ncbi:MAG: SpoIIE family protein phosphatase [Thermoanaerobaculia bacterium]|nr:SpoIIE family protein phosphatase [Thermoanaerobaculia bacterium]